MDYYDLYDITPEEEAAQDAREAEREVEDWLASWSDDFHSDEWAAALPPNFNADRDAATELHSNHEAA